MIKFILQAVVIAVIMLGIIVGLLMFGISDYRHPEIFETKPWRPFARLVFSFVMISGVALLGGAVIRAIYRTRE